MATKPSPADIARDMRADLVARRRDARRMRSFTFWRAFGVLRRTPASVERVRAALAAAGLQARSGFVDLGEENRLDWITVHLAEATIAAPHPPPVSFVSAPEPPPDADVAPQPAVAPTLAPRPAAAPAAAHPPLPRPPTDAPHGRWAGVRMFVGRHPIAFVLVLFSLCGVLTSGLSGPLLVMAALVWAAVSSLFTSGGFGTRHPLAFTTLLFGATTLIVGDQLETLVVIACVVWLARVGLQRAPWLAERLPSVDTVLSWADGHRVGAVLTSVLALGTLGAFGQMLGFGPPDTGQPRRTPAAVASAEPAATTAPAAEPADTTSIVAPAATATDEPAPTVDRPAPTTEPPTAVPTPAPTRTSPPPPSTRTPVPPPPTPRPPIDIDPNRNQNCDSFPNYETMKAWRDYWRARGVANPGRLDGDGDGLACEEGEGGRPAPPPPPPPPAPVPLYQAPAPAPPSGGGGGGGGCCKYCKAGVSKPCGDSCISLNKNCHKGAGCACQGG